MSTTPQLAPLVRGYLALDSTQLSTTTIIEQLQQGLGVEWKLIDIVKLLQDALTSDQDQTRSRGVQLLSSLVQSMQPNQLDRQSTKVLTTFFTTKLSDSTHSLVPCVVALTKLTQGENFGTMEGIEVVKGIYSSVVLKNYPQSIRHTLYTLLDSLMSNCRPSLVRMGKEFIKGYCQFVEGEKDPRNLMISFGLVRIIVLEFDIEGCVEDLFDITFCYFPITFTPPPDDPYGITSQDLIVALRSCLASTPLFGPLALPLFLDKLQAASEKAKRQTLEALTSTFPIYGAKISGEWAERFSEALSIEVFHATDRGLQDLSLIAFNSLFRTLYPDDDDDAVEEKEESSKEGDEIVMHQKKDGDGEIKGIAVQVVKNCLNELEEPDKNNAKPAMRILVSLMSASNRLAQYIIEKTLPPLLSIAQNPEETSLRPSALSHVSNLLTSLSIPEPREEEISSKNQEESPELPTSLPPPSLDHSSPTSPLRPYLDTLLSLLTSAIRSHSPARQPALQGLIALIKLSPPRQGQFLTIEEIEFCVSSFNEIISESIEEGDDDESYDLALDDLIIVSKLYPKTIETLTLPILFAQLPTTTTTSEEGGREGEGEGEGGGIPKRGAVRSERYRKSLVALAALSLGHPDLFETLSMRISARLEDVLSTSPDSSSTSTTNDNDDATSLYAHHLLSTLRSVLATKIYKRQDRDVPKYLETLIPRLLRMFILPTIVDRDAMDQEEKSLTVTALDMRLLIDVGKIIGLVLQKVETERQTTFYRAMDEAFRGGDLSALIGEKTSTGSSFKPFSPDSTVHQSNLISLYTSTLLSLRLDVPIPSSSLLDLLRTLLSRSQRIDNELQLQSIVHALSNLINKRISGTNGEAVKEFIEIDLEKSFAENVENGDKDLRVRTIGLKVWIWVAKGLIVRSDERGYRMIERVLGLFSDLTIGRSAATLLGIVAEDGDRVLSKENFSVIRLLYKQRFFTFLLPKLVAAHKEQRGPTPSSTSSGDQAVYLIALSSLLQHLPKQLTLTELPKLLPLLITSLDLPDPSLRSNVIDTLGILVKEVPSELEPSISSMTVKVLRSAIEELTSDSIGSTKLRISSLRFLALLPAHIPYLTLHPQKTAVIKGLGNAIDDRRREVRKAAVECRSKWYSYN